MVPARNCGGAPGCAGSTKLCPVNAKYSGPVMVNARRPCAPPPSVGDTLLAFVQIFV